MAAPQQVADGLCLRFSGDIANQPSLPIEMAVNLLLRGTQASMQLPFAWGYIDRPADGAVYLVFIPSHMTFPNDGMRFQENEQRFTIAAGNGREVEVMESKYGFTPGTGENVANRIRRKFRLIKGGNPQLILIHYCRGQAVPVNPAFNQPTRSYPLQPANLPPVFIAGEKAGQKVLQNTPGGPPVGNVPGGVPGGIPPGMQGGMQGNIPGGIPGGMPGGMGGGMPGGPGGPGPQQHPPNQGPGPGHMQGVPNQQHPPHPGHPPLQPPGPQGVPPQIGMGYPGPATTQSMLAQQNRQMEALERRNAQEREQRARSSMNAPRPSMHADEDEEMEKEMISTRTLALTRFQRNHEFMDEVFLQAALGDKHQPKRKSPWSIFEVSELESKSAKLTAEIAELERQAEERRSQRSALAGGDGDVSMSAISV